MPRGINKNNPTKAEVLEALERTAGNIKEAIGLLNIGTNTFYKKWRHDPEVEEFLVKVSEAKMDELTEILIDLCREKNTAAIGLTLKYSPMAHRAGWTDTRTVTVRNDKPLTDDEKEQLKKEMFS